MTERLHFHFSLSCIGEGNGNTLQCSCLENPIQFGAIDDELASRVKTELKVRQWPSRRAGDDLPVGGEPASVAATGKAARRLGRDEAAQVSADVVEGVIAGLVIHQ